MGFIDKLNEFFVDLMIDWIIGNMTALFDNFNDAVGEIANQAGFLPSAPQSAVFAGVPALLAAVSQSVLIPIAALVLAGTLTWEFFQLIVEKNNVQDIDTSLFLRWGLRAFVAIMIVSYAHEMVNAVFEVGNWMTNALAAEVSGGDMVPADAFSSINRDALKAVYADKIEMRAALFGAVIASLLLRLTLMLVSVVVTIIMLGRIIEIYMVVSLAPLPLSAMVNRNWGVGQSYLKRVAALALQGFMLMILLAIYRGMLNGWAAEFASVTPENLATTLWKIQGYFFVLIFAMFSSKNVANSILGAH